MALHEGVTAAYEMKIVQDPWRRRKFCNLHDVEYNFLLRVWDKDNTQYGIESLIFPIFHTDSENLQTICQTLRKFQPISI